MGTWEKNTGSSLKGVSLTGQIWDNLSIKINIKI